jgi:hypothetical protein
MHGMEAKARMSNDPRSDPHAGVESDADPRCARIPADKINPVAVQAMAEEGIDIAAEQPKLLHIS